jgi:hypothetical protein
MLTNNNWRVFSGARPLIALPMMAKSTSPALPPNRTATAARTRCHSCWPSSRASSRDSIRPSSSMTSAAVRAGALPRAATPMPTVRDAVS